MSDKYAEILRKAQEYSARAEKDKGKRYISQGAFWLSPTGEVSKTTHGMYHIGDVITNPEKFGMNREDIESLYDEEGEPIGQEGKARDSIMVQLLKEGWIRIRRRKNNYSVQVWEFNNQTISNLEEFARTVTEEGINNEFSHETDELVVHSLKTDKIRKMELRNIIKGHLHEANECDYHVDILYGLG